MILEGAWYAQLFKALGAIIVIGGFISLWWKSKKGAWPWEK